MLNSHIQDRKSRALKICFLGAGTWAYCLADLLASNGHHVTLWSANAKLFETLQKTRQHPNLPGYPARETLSFTQNLEEAARGAEMICEAVTSAGIRPVFMKLASLPHVPDCPIVLTSKGIEQNTGLLLSEVLLQVLGQKAKKHIGCLSGPSLAAEVIKGLPISVVSSSYAKETMQLIQEAFNTLTFRVYCNGDIHGVEFGGAMKNIIAIACGISDGLGFGDNTKAALMTRGLHEIRKLSITKGCRPETLNGLSGMGDLCATCLSTLSRNYRFGRLLADGMTPGMAKETIGVVVEGAYTCVSALQLGQQAHIAVPITEAVYQVIYEGRSPKDCVNSLLSRSLKEEHL